MSTITTTAASPSSSSPSPSPPRQWRALLLNNNKKKKKRAGRETTSLGEGEGKGREKEEALVLLDGTQIRHVAAMTLSRTIAQCLIHPIDTIKTRLQVDNPGKKLQKYLRKAREAPVIIRISERNVARIHKLSDRLSNLSRNLYGMKRHAPAGRSMHSTTLRNRAVSAMARSTVGTNIALRKIALNGNLRVMDNYFVKGIFGTGSPRRRRHFCIHACVTSWPTCRVVVSTTRSKPLRDGSCW